MRLDIKAGDRIGGVPGVSPLDVGQRLCALNDISKLMLESLLRIEGQLLENNQKIQEAMRKGDALVAKGDELLAKGDEVNQRGDGLKTALEANAATRG